MIVDKGQQQQLAINEQQQHQQRHLVSRTQNLAATPIGCAGENVDEDGDCENDEENIVIDMADEDDDGEEDEQDGANILQQTTSRYQLESQVGQFNHDHNDASIHGFYTNNNIEDTPINYKDHETKLRCSADERQRGEIERRHFQPGDLVWFDPNQYGYSIPGKVIDYYPDMNVLTVEGYAQPTPEIVHDGQYELSSELELEHRNKLLLEADNDLQLYELNDQQQLLTVRQRQPLTNLSGRDDIVDLEELSLDSIIWNLKLRYKQEIVYTRCGHKILISVNPCKQLCNLYNLDQVNKYDTINPTKLRSLTECFPNNSNYSSSLIRWLLLQDGNQQIIHRAATKQKQPQPDTVEEPHIFHLANEALKKLLISGQDQCFVLLGESGSGKTEACKLLVQYLATVNKSPTNLMTEQILESIQVLESFGNAKTVLNDNSSRFGKLLDIRINLSNGFILDAKTLDLNLLDRTRIVSQTENERSYHIFYELLAGLNAAEKEKYGLQTAEKYFYLNQGHCVDLASKEDGEDFRSLLASMQVLGFNYEEQDTIFRLLASVLHLGNIYFHRKVLAVRSGKLAQQQQKLFNDQHLQATGCGGVEGVEIGSDTEVRWVSHLLQIQFDLVLRCLTVRTTETGATSALAASNNQSQQLVVDRIVTPLNIDQALDTRDAIARALYTCLFKWLIKRINIMINGNQPDASDAKVSDQSASVTSRVSTFTSRSSTTSANNGEPIYLCRTSDSLCEFQPDKLAEANSLKRSKQSLASGGERQRGKQASAKQQKLAKLAASASINILDAFGFENLNENNFEQLCINYAAELLQYHTNRYLVRLEQAEYAKERLRWTPVNQLLVLTATGGCETNVEASQSMTATSCSGASGAGASSQHGNHAAAIVNLISKKPLGILALLDDECNFPKATDQSFAEKCHHNHTLNDNYQRARLTANCQEFGVRHFRQSNRLVWYQVDGFIEKNRDVLRPDIVDLLLGSKMNIVADMLRRLHEAQDFASSSKTLSRTFDGRYVSMKPRATTVAARFQDALHNNRVLESINYSSTSGGQVIPAEHSSHYWSSSLSRHADNSANAHQQQVATQRPARQPDAKPNPWFVVCIKPNRSLAAQVFDVAYVQEQARSFGIHEIGLMRKTGYPVRMRYGEFVRRYKCLVPQKFLNNLASCQDIQAANRKLTNQRRQHRELSGQPSPANQSGEIKRAIREVCSAIVESRFVQNQSDVGDEMKDQEKSDTCEISKTKWIRSRYQCGLTKMFLNEKLYHELELMRLTAHQNAIQLIQKTLRMWLVQRDYLIKRQAAIVIQAQVRGHLSRCEFWRQYMLIVGLQRRWRHQLGVKRQLALETRRRQQRQQQLHQLHELQALQKKQANQFRHRQVLALAAAGSSKQQQQQAADKSHYAVLRSGLDIPQELEQFYRLQRDWNPVHDLCHLAELNLGDLREQELRRRTRYPDNDNGLSVPFLAAIRADDIKFKALINLKQQKQSHNDLVSGIHEDQRKRQKLMHNIEIDERYSLHKFPSKYYTIESPQFGYSRLPITRSFSWQQTFQKRLEALRWKSEMVGDFQQRAYQLENEIHRRFDMAENRALLIYKLILRYVDSDLGETSRGVRRNIDHHHNEKHIDAAADMQKLVKFKLIADYVIYLCTCEPLLRNEIYLQLASQSWQNPKQKSAENVWKLMCNCLNCFGPNDMELAKFLLRFASDYCCDRYRTLIMDRLARFILASKETDKSHESAVTRKYPPSMLEYCANQEAIGELALAVSSYMDDHAFNLPPTHDDNGDDDDDDGQVSPDDLSTVNHTNRTVVQVGPLTSAEQLAAAALHAKQVPPGNLAGWSVEFQHEGAQSELSYRLRGDDKLMDHLSRVELLPDLVSSIEAGNEAWLHNMSLTLTASQAGVFQQAEAASKLVFGSINGRISAQSGARYAEPANGHKLDRRARKLSMSELQYPISVQSRANMMMTTGNNVNSSHRHSVASSQLSPGDYVDRRQVATHSSEQDLSEFTNPGRLSRTSKLNRRFLNELTPRNEGFYPTEDYAAQQINGGRYNDGYLGDDGGYAAHYGDRPQAQHLLHRRSMSMQELQLAASSALNGRYFNASNQHQQQPTQPLSSHYASSQVSNQARAIHHDKQVSPLQQLNGVGYRRSRTPNSASVHSSHRMSSSAYGSESRNSSSYLTGANPIEHHNQMGERRARLHERPSAKASQSGSLSRDGRLPHQMMHNNPGQRGPRPRRSASSSSRAPRVYLPPNNGTGSDYAYSDYERVGGGRYATPVATAYQAPEHPNSAGRPTVNQAASGKQLAGNGNKILQRQFKAPQQQSRKFNAPSDPARRDDRQVALADFGRPVAASNFSPNASSAQQQAASNHYMASSALSDTSEAPSLASHVRGVKVPQHNGDLDQYLDDLFNPMLGEAELDELSDARSLATSIRGTGFDVLEAADVIAADLSNLCDPTCLSAIIRGSSDAESGGDLSSAATSSGQQDREKSVLSPTFESLLQSLNNQSDQLTLDECQQPVPVSGDRQQLSTSGEGPMIPLSSQLGEMNLSELKALNEKLEHEIQAAQLSNRLSLEESKIPVPPPQPIFAVDDLYDRAKTVRIGKWRWPPARYGSAPVGGQEQAQPGAAAVESATLIANYYESRERKARLSQQSNSSSLGHDEAGAGMSSHTNPELDVSKQSKRAGSEMAPEDQVQQVAAGDSIKIPVPLGVGKLKISSEMKAKLEQLTTGTSAGGRDSATPTPPQQQNQTSGIVSQARLSLLALASFSANELGQSDQVNRVNEQRRNLLESQLLGGQHHRDEPSSNSKVIAAKQQLAAAAGVALDALDGMSSVGTSQASSRRQSDLLVRGSFEQVADGQEVEAGSNVGPGNVSAPTRHSRVLHDELGPQSKSAISQRQAFYQMSVSSDQLDHLSATGSTTAGGAGDKGKRATGCSGEHGGSELHLASELIPPPPPNASLSSDNLQQASSGGQPLARAMQMSSHLNEAGQSSPLGQESDRIYGRSIAKSLSQRQHESLLTGADRKGDERRSHLQQTDQWVSSSPDRTLEGGISGARSSLAPSTRNQAIGQRQSKRLSTEPELQVAKRRGQAHSMGANQAAKSRTVGAAIPQSRENSREQAHRSSEESRSCMIYANIDWQVKIRKEFFLPSETYSDPLVVQLIFAQLVADVFNPRHWTRFNNKERAAMKALMKDNSIGYAPSLPQIGQLQQVKRDLIRMARSFGLYFTRSYKATNFALTCMDQRAPSAVAAKFPVVEHIRRRRRSSLHSAHSASSPDDSCSGEDDQREGDEQLALDLLQKLQNANNIGLEWIDMVAVHHSGLRLVAAGEQQSTEGASAGYQVLETLKYRDMTDVSQVSRCELLISMQNKKRSWLISSPEVAQLGSLLKCFHADYNDHLGETSNSAAAATATSGGSNKPASSNKETTANSSAQKRERRANKDALLASDDDHHGDHIKQRQIADRINRLHPAAHTNDDLAYSERVLSDDLASSLGPFQQSKQSGALDGIADGQYESTLSATAADGSRLAPAERRPTGGQVKPDQLAESAGCRKQAKSGKKQGVASLKSGDESNESTKPESCNGKKRNLWQNSLSRMSNKFSIFGGNNQSRAKQTSADLIPSNNIKAINNGKQSNELPIVQVALDAWIETKVDFDEDEDTITANGASNCASPSPLDSQSAGARASSTYRFNDADRQDAMSPDLTAGDESRRSSQKGSPTGNQSAPSETKSTLTDHQHQNGPSEADGRYSLLQFALYNFREAIDKYSLESRASKAAQTGAGSGDTSTLRGSLKLIETLRGARGSSILGQQSERSANGKERKGSRLQQQVDSSAASTDWTWRELAEMVKFTQVPIKQSLLKLPSEDLNKLAVDCFLAIMRYMGDAPQSASNGSSKPHYQANEVQCVYLILMNCHNYPILKDEIYCQLMKQTTNNRSTQQDSCLRGWRLFSIVAAYFDCSEPFKPYLLKYLETAAFDKRRAYCSVAALCLQNLRKTFRYNGRKNVPSIEEIAATSAGRNSKRQIYRLPGGTERVINTKSTTVVEDIIHEICSNMLNVTDPDEMLEFSLYCIADGDLYTMPLNLDEYILDITTELIKNHQQYFLIFCRSIWHYPLRLDSKLYIEVIFNQIAPDYLEGLLLVLPSLRAGRKGLIDYKQPLRLKTKLVKEIARIAALLHRASGTDHMPHKDEVKYLLPKPIVSAMKQHQRALISADHLSAGSTAGSASSSSSSTAAGNEGSQLPSAGLKTLSAKSPTAAALAPTTTSHLLDTVITTPQKWIELVQNNWREMSAFDTLDAKAQFLDIVRHWPLFGSSFFAIKFIQRDLIQPMDFILALNKLGIQMLDMATHETIHKYPFNEVISTRKVRSEDGALFLDLKCGNLMKRTIIRIQTDQAHEISRLIRQYIDIELLQQKQRHQQELQQYQTQSGQEVQLMESEYADCDPGNLNCVSKHPISEQESS